MPGDIWHMLKLRHLFIKGGGVFHFEVDPSVEAKRGYMKGPKRNPMLENLQTLQPLCACKSCLMLLRRTPNIRKLGLSENLRYGGMAIPDLRFLKQLESLSVKTLEFRQSRLPDVPASLRKLTLRGTIFIWDDEVSCLPKVKNLEVLKLLDGAVRCCFDQFVMRFYKDWTAWDTREVDFPKLKYLKMQNLDIQKWVGCNLEFESLEVLVLEDCDQPESIPFDLAQSPSLHTIEVTRCSTSLGILVKEIEAEHESQCGNTNLQVFITS